MVQYFNTTVYNKTEEEEDSIEIYRDNLIPQVNATQKERFLISFDV